MLRQFLWSIFLAVLQLAAGDWYPPNYDVCDNSQCALIQQILTDNVEYDVEACDDFFRFSCKSAHLDLNLMSHGSDINDLEEILTTTNRTEDVSIDRALQIEKKIYQQCLNSQGGSQLLFLHFYLKTHDTAKSRYESKVFQSHPVNRMNLLDDRDKTAWLEQDIDYAKKGFGFAFFELDIVEIDNAPSNYEGNSQKRFIQISPTSDDIIEINNLLSSEYFEKHTSASSMKFDELKKFIPALNKIIPAQYSSFDDYADRRQVVSISKWQDKYDKMVLKYKPYKYEFSAALETVFEEVGIKITPSEDLIVVKNEEYFYKLTELFRNYHTLTIEKYIHLRYVLKTVGFVDERYKKFAIIPAIDGLKCTPGLFIATAHEYAKKYFADDTREAAKTIYRNIKNFIEMRLRGGNLDSPTKENTNIFLNLLNKTNVIFGYPEWLLQSYMTEIYDNYFNSQSFNPDISYYNKQVEAVRTLLHIKLAPYKKKQLPIVIMDNLYKSFSTKIWEIPLDLKQILIPIRIFSENNYKFLSSYLQEPFNYGAFGSALASELYYTWLRQIGYDLNVKYCVKRQIPDYADKYEVDLTYLSRATSYVLGLQTAYKVYDSTPQRNFSVPIFVVDFGTEPSEVMFFISFGESMCRWSDPRLNLKDKEVFMSFAVSQIPEFSDAFTCQKAKRQRLILREKCNPLEDYGL